jgi:hypothetical protein
MDQASTSLSPELQLGAEPAAARDLARQTSKVLETFEVYVRSINRMGVRLYKHNNPSTASSVVLSA